MTVHKRWELQAALVAHLEEALADYGIASEDTDDDVDGDLERVTGPVPVLTDVTEAAHQFFVRIDGFAFIQGTGASGRVDRYPFMVHVFCAATSDQGDAIIDPEAKGLQVQNLILSALDGFQPFAGAGRIEHRSSTDVPDDNSALYHGVSRFMALITGEE